MRALYPEISENHSFFLPVDELHTLYVEECGNPDGLPALFLHGGPGAGCENNHRRFFNPGAWRIVLFDQRGSGRSTPHAELKDNTTQHLIADIEKIRAHLGIERWVVFGGSWGSTLALAYAAAHPQRCLSLILRGVFLCRRRDLLWFYQDGARFLFPDWWRSFEEVIASEERGDMIGAYYRRLTGDDEQARLKAAIAWSVWEGRTATLRPKPAVVEFFSNPHIALSLARIECHYFINRIFLDEGQLLDDAAKIADIPGVIVHGRYDAVCPLEQAWLLHRHWPRAQLQIADGAGHSAFEPAIIHRLVEATDAAARQFAGR
ncbi:MAG: prolyl aminopeptidase [Gammaproteobacteria bacterium]|nr:prolyl aminopeptidase [Gammaproteobacteria bacterium]